MGNSFFPSIRPPDFLQDSVLGPDVKVSLQKNIHTISDESLIKIFRQLEFWYSQKTLTKEQFLSLVDRLIHTANWFHRYFPNTNNNESSTIPQLKSRTQFDMPRVRFGRTELQMPIVTCGGMRFQQTWLPDFVPYLSPRRSAVLVSPSQSNIKDIVRHCLALGLNHFETARFYGTSEYQLVDALHELIASKEVKREDFIFQTKVGPTKTRADFEKSFLQSWNNIESKIGYIDLLAIHGLGSPHHFDDMMSNDSFLDAAIQYKNEGKVRFIGFSTHGTADNIMRFICTNKFDFINLHCHFFGSYHAEGTPDSVGGYGNVGCVKKALELDMGVFCISPFDKGGKLYQPSKTVASTIGPELSPIAFAALYDWKVLGFHTISVGFGRPSDLDEVLSAVEMYRENEFSEMYNAVDRLQKLKEEKLGAQWIQKEYENIATCWEASSSGVGIAHLLWLHDLVSAYGMYDFAYERYEMCEKMSLAWKSEKSIEENAQSIQGYAFNPGTSLRPDVDILKALDKHYDPEAVLKKVNEVNNWLCKEKITDTNSRGVIDSAAAYSLTTWKDYPGQFTMRGIMLQNLTGGLLGAGGGKDTKTFKQARFYRKLLS